MCIDSIFPSVTTTALRIYVLASNDGVQSWLAEVEACGAEGEPRSWDLEMYGGSGWPFPE